jgi:uncharacterized metal-binding protein
MIATTCFPENHKNYTRPPLIGRILNGFEPKVKTGKAHQNILNRAKTELNIQMGLCLGHDILFQKNAESPVTVLTVKDRALANNPMGVVYGSYWKSKLLGLK